jgi:hypothetical protein
MKKILTILLLGSYIASVSANDAGYFGLLRSRDLTPFGYLRLGMRPAHAISGPSGSWGIEMELGYQNTWALSPEVERYLTNLPDRRELGPAEAAAIRALPGENYLLDLELAQLDMTFHYKFAEQWGGYFTLSGASYDGGFLDATIEEFHDRSANRWRLAGSNPGCTLFGRQGTKQLEFGARGGNQSACPRATSLSFKWSG